jgi:hypothetical protein
MVLQELAEQWHCSCLKYRRKCYEPAIRFGNNKSANRSTQISTGCSTQFDGGSAHRQHLQELHRVDSQAIRAHC